MKIFVIALLVVLIGCSSKTSSPQEEVKVDSLNKNVSYPVKVSLQEAMKNVDNTITLSSFVDSVEYIPLKLPNKYGIRFFKSMIMMKKVVCFYR